MQATPETRHDYDSGYLSSMGVIQDAQRPLHRAWRAFRHFSEFYLPLGLRPGDRILDVGSCIGTMGNNLKYGGVTTVGIDINQAALEVGRTIFGQSRKNVGIRTDSDCLPFLDKSFKTVVSEDLFEHLSGMEFANRTFQEMVRVCAGDKMVHKITVLEDRDWIDDDPTHTLKLSAKDWQEWFEMNGWKVISDTTRKFPVRRGLFIGSGEMHGYYLVERQHSLG